MYIFILKSLAPILLASILMLLTLSSCEKYSDPAPIDDPNLDGRSYCNDPKAINYNWGFPGTPDNSLCIYPADIWIGEYEVADSFYSESDSFLSAMVHDPVSIEYMDQNYVLVKGLCNSTDYKFLCTRYLELSTDTINQNLYDHCGSDTFAVTGSKAHIDTTIFEIYLQNKNLSDGYHRMRFIKK